jgi:hypothetical protein
MAAYHSCLHIRSSYLSPANIAFRGAFAIKAFALGTKKPANDLKAVGKWQFK